MPTYRKPLTLDQRIQRGIEVHQFRFDDYREVADPHLHCEFCQDSILIDYLQFGMMEMARRLSSWVATHSKCEPQLATKTKDMILAPVEGKS